MFSEPKNKQLSIKEIHEFSVLNHLLSSYVATLALYSREHFDTLPNFDRLEKITTNTEVLMKEAIKIIEKSEFVVKENIQLLCRRCNLTKADKDPFDFALECGRLV